jgi:hypothetical protein
VNKDELVRLANYLRDMGRRASMLQKHQTPTKYEYYRGRSEAFITCATLLDGYDESWDAYPWD